MGIRVTCPNGHKLHVKSHLAGKRGICPQCGASIPIPPDEPPPPASALAAAQGPENGQLDAASSILVAVAEPATPGHATVQASPPVLPVDIATFAEAIAATHTALAPVDASIVVEPNAAEAPATGLVARRARNRRNQLAITVALLVAVIVLAVILIWVLRRGSGQPTTATSMTPLIHRVANL